MFDVAVIEDPVAAQVSLDPMRARLLAALSEPGSATTLAAQVGLARQKVNYHLRALEQHGLVELVEERRKGNVTERRAAGDRPVLRHLAGRAVAGRARSVSVTRPALGALAARGRRPTRA